LPIPPWAYPGGSVLPVYLQTHMGYRGAESVPSVGSGIFEYLAWFVFRERNLCRRLFAKDSLRMHLRFYWANPEFGLFKQVILHKILSILNLALISILLHAQRHQSAWADMGRHYY
jgi:hypothetical protein